ncbi:hypothetical protein D3C80_1207430 [compost metagenome]
MTNVLPRNWHTQALEPLGTFPDRGSVADARLVPIRHTAQLYTADNPLHFHHAPVGAKALMQPAETGGMLTLIDSFPALAMILECPHFCPKLPVVGGDHATLAAGSHDLVLTKRPCAYVTNGTNRTPLVRRTMRLRTIFDHFQVVLSRQRHDRVHVARPSGEVNTDNGPRTRCQYRANGFGSDILGIPVNFSKNRDRPGIDDAGHRSKERPRRDNDFVTAANTQRIQCEVQRNGTICKRYRMSRPDPSSELLLELTALLACPVIDLVGQHDIANSIGLFFGE